MKKSSVNTFTEGLVCDLDPINVPNNVLTDCLNGTIITYDDNEFSLQNDKGNYPLEYCKLKPDFIPIGIKEYNGILYIISLNPLTGEEQIGSYPSPKMIVKSNIDNCDFQYIVKSKFSEQTDTVDYNDLIKECKTVYFVNPDVKLNVGDKFQINLELSDEKSIYETVSYYVIDENSKEHLITDDWKSNNQLYYISKVSGIIAVKNKISELANSMILTNSFITYKDSESDTLNSIITLTNEIEIEDSLTLNALLNNGGELYYDIEVYKNTDLIFSNSVSNYGTYSYSNDSITMHCKNGLFKEWYQDFKIASKSVIAIIKDVLLEDEIFIKITPKLKENDNYITYSNKTTIERFSPSEYIEASWSIGEERYKFYNDDSKQYIEFNVDGPIELNNDLSLQYKIFTYSNVDLEKSVQVPGCGIGLNKVIIPFDNWFKKESVYGIKFELCIAGEIIASSKYRTLLTTEIFNERELYLSKKHSDCIDYKDWFKYYKLKEEGSVNISNSTKTNKKVSMKSQHNFSDSVDYVSRSIIYPNHISSSEADTIFSSDARLDCTYYNCKLTAKLPKPLLEGPIWSDMSINGTVHDSLSKIVLSSGQDKEKTIELPSGIGVNISINKEFDTVGRYSNTSAIDYQTTPIKYLWSSERMYNGEYVIGLYKWKNNDWDSVPIWYLSHYSNEDGPDEKDVTSKVKALIQNDLKKPGPVELYLERDGEDTYQAYIYINDDETSTYEDKLVFSGVCPKSGGNSIFASCLDSALFPKLYKINADSNAKFESGYWITFSDIGTTIDFRNLKVQLSGYIDYDWSKFRNFANKMKENNGYYDCIGTSDEIELYEYTYDSNVITINNSNLDYELIRTEIDNINIRCNTDKEHSKLIPKAEVGKYVKGIYNQQTKSYYNKYSISDNFRSGKTNNILATLNNNPEDTYFLGHRKKSYAIETLHINLISNYAK